MTDKSVGISQLLVGTCPGCPIEVYAYELTSLQWLLLKAALQRKVFLIFPLIPVNKDLTE